ncbi:MAG: flagellar assembly peptidoglycan hydrolase FlgJ [Candidatus Nitricoxidivorans perseverans]|uniref:Peptidoglycan hydrolase FlgJ n=1 Tax=Candidatus Nitricoxidivorans perseverans TaxID=2975601 RepID=A0AA49FNR0_9PROT|nr:MAG: flagellar assembly peptidoglycan hydrolase FlgJ [Candidatus Nitricoxidivorans perseverans]
MNPTVDPSIFDPTGLAAIKRGVKSNDPQALKATARQFEALFMQMVLKSMRDATPREGLFDSEQTRLYESLLDQQLSQALTAKGGTGLAAMIEKQLSRVDEAPAAPGNGLPLNPEATPHPLPPSQGVPLPLPDSRDFVSRVWPEAIEASRVTGIPAHFMVAQAALETSWGRSEPRMADGRPSHNIFGIKAGRAWTGAVAEAATTEYENGISRQRVERFRAYGSYAEAFRDYASLLLSAPRYAGVVGTQDAASFARGLQRAGYATDPMYAAKLERIIGGGTLRTALAG